MLSMKTSDCNCCHPSFSTSLHTSPAPAQLPSWTQHLGGLHTKSGISLNSPHSLRPAFQAGALGLIPGQGKENRRNWVVDFRSDKPDFKALQAMISRIQRCVLITAGRKETKARARGKMQQGRQIKTGSKCRDEDVPSTPRLEPTLLQGSTPVSCL